MDFIYKERLQKHKSKPANFVSTAGGVKERLKKTIQYRKSCRRTGFDVGRDLSSDEVPDPTGLTKIQQAQERRKQQLEKWKKDKEEKKREAAKCKKKPFVTGVHHAPLSYIPPPPILRAQPSTSGRVTRSTTRAAKQQTIQSFAPPNAKFQPPKLAMSSNMSLPLSLQNHSKKNKYSILTFNPTSSNTLKGTRSRTNMSAEETSYRMTRSRQTIATISNNPSKKDSPKKYKKKTPKETKQSSQETMSDFGYQGSSSDHSPVILKRKSLHKQQEIPELLIESPILQSKTPRRSLPKVTITATPKSNIPKSESSSEERLRSPKEMVTETESSKEVMAKTPEQILEEYSTLSPCVTVSRGKSNARKEMKKKLREGLLQDEESDLEDVDRFRRQLDSEVVRISALCDSWHDLRRQVDLPDLAQEQVLAAVGQARLLMSSKFQQFAGLVDKCEAHDVAAGLVTPADLQGFWDMLCLQIQNVDERFKKMEELRERDWREEPEVQKATKSIAGRRPRPGPSARPAAAGPSRLREMIAAARKKQQSSSEPSTEVSEDKTFEAGFFCVKSPVRTPVTRTPAGTPAGTPARHSLLKDVLSSEARKASASKNTSSSFAMLRASFIGKNVEIEGIAPLQQTPNLPSIDLNATPARSILKNRHDVEKSGKKSIKTVLFDQSLSPLEKDNIPEENASHTDLQAIDNGVAAMVIHTTVDISPNKENSRRRRSKIVRQDNIDSDDSPAIARNRKSEEKPGRSTRRNTNVLQAIDVNPIEDTVGSAASKRRSSTRKSVKNMLQEIDVNPIEDTVGSAASKRRSYRRKSPPKNMEEDSKMATPRSCRYSRRLSRKAQVFTATPEPITTPKAVSRRGKKSENAENA